MIVGLLTPRRGEVRINGFAVPALTKSGRRISVEFTIVMLRNERQEIAGTVAVMRDVTKRFEELRELKRRLAQAGVLS